MEHLRKFNEEFFSEERLESKFFWLKDKDGRTGSGLTVGKYDPNTTHEGGSENNYQWEIIASDEIYTEENIRNMFDVLEEIKRY